MKFRAVIFAAVMLLPGLYTVTGTFAQDDDPIQVTVPKPSGEGTVSSTTAPAVTPPAPAAAAATTKFYLEVDTNDLAVLGAALNELPKKIADPIVLKLNGQINAQTQIVANKDAAEKAKRPEKGKR